MGNPVRKCLHYPKKMTEAQIEGSDRWREMTTQGKTGTEIYHDSLMNWGEDREHLLLPHRGFQQLLGTRLKKHSHCSQMGLHCSCDLTQSMAHQLWA